MYSFGRHVTHVSVELASVYFRITFFETFYEFYRKFHKTLPTRLYAAEINCSFYAVMTLATENKRATL